MPSDGLQDALARVVSDTSSADIPKNVVEAAERIVLDTIAIGIAGARAPYRDALWSAVHGWGSEGRCHMLGEQLRLPAPSAAFINTFQMHCLEFDAVHEAAVAHVATAPVAALLAEIDTHNEPVCGQRFLTALIVGVEVAATLGLAAEAPLTFFRPATTGVFGAAAAIGSLRGFDVDAANRSFAYALASAAGTMQAHEEGMPTLPIQLANAARAGLIAADLAETGIPTAKQAIAGKFGYLALFESKASTTGLLQRIAAPWRISEMAIKPYPSGRATHGGIEAMRALRGRGLRAENLDTATLIAPPLINQLVNRPAHQDMNANYARLCFPYVAACALRDDCVTIDDFSPNALCDAETLSIAEKIEVRTSDIDDPSAFTPQRLVAVTQDGERRETNVEHLLGAPEHPMSDAQSIRKLEDCLRSREAADALVSACGGLWQCSDVGERLDNAR